MSYKKLFFIVSLVFLTFTGCYAQRFYVRVRPVFIERPHPPVPHPGWVWVGPEWVWRGGNYVQVDGYWSRPRPNFYWVPGHWEEEGPRGHFWIPGHWQGR
ncbi:MAG: hypothetical protein QM528_06745 [Phycisphaerales bacterium]|nr:hypothetical protein [Phycisphaerales bacterium]